MKISAPTSHQLLFLLSCIPFLFVDNSHNFFTDGLTARFIEPGTNSLWMHKESGIGDLLPFIWKILFAASAVTCAVWLERLKLIPLTGAILMIGVTNDFSLFYALPLLWTLLTISIGGQPRSVLRLAGISVISVCGALWLGPWQTLATVFAIVPLFKARFFLSEVCLLALPSVCASILTFYPFSDSYPAGASVSALTGVAWIGRPFWGPDLQFLILDKLDITRTYGAQALVLSLITFATLFTFKNKKLIESVLVLGLVLALELFFPPMISDISPVAVLGRIVPGLWNISLVPLLLSLLSLGTLELVSHTRPLLPLLLIPLLILLQLNVSTPKDIARSLVPKAVWVSPSASVIKIAGDVPWLAMSNYRSVHLGDKHFSLVSPGGEKASILSDHNPNSRIRLENRSKSEFCIEFSVERTILGVVLATGSYPADFPRGLRIESTPECASDVRQVLFDQNPWRGRILFTDSGLPYFGSQSDVRAVFAGPTTVKALRFIQTGFDPTFDWSVSGLSLLLPAKNNQ